jgi:hypothetical protein
MFKKKTDTSSSKNTEGVAAYEVAKELLDIIKRFPVDERFSRTGLRHISPDGLGIIDRLDLLPRCVASDLIPDSSEILGEPIRYTVYAHADGQLGTMADVSFDRVSALGEKNSGIHKTICYSVYKGGEGTVRPSMPPLFVDKYISECLVTIDGQVTDLDTAPYNGQAVVFPDEAAEIISYLVRYLDPERAA